MGQSSSTPHPSAQHSSSSSQSRTSHERREREHISQSANTFSDHSDPNTGDMRGNIGGSGNNPRRTSTSRSSNVGSDGSRERVHASLDSRSSSSRRHNTTRMDQQSTMSRLGTRILPNAVVRGLLNSGEETPAEGRAHRTGLFSRHGPHRFPTFSNISSRGIARRRSIRGPYPLPRGETTLLPDSSPSLPYPHTSLAEETPDSRLSWRRRAGNVRHSIAGPISQIFGQPNPPESYERARTPPRRPSNSSFIDHSNQLTPSGTIDSRMELDEPPESDSPRPSTRHSRQSSSASSSRTNQGSSGSRRQSGTGRRSGRLLRRDEQFPLSRVLQLAAAAIAAQLSGNTGAAIPNIQSPGSESAEGSLEHFIQTLRQATTAQARNPDADGDGSSQTGGDLPHVNFLRVFRFSNPDNQQQSPSTSGQSEAAHDAQTGPDSDRMEVDGSETGEGGQRDRRLVTLVVVGVRSVNTSSNGSPSDNNRGNARATLDSFLRLPMLSSNNILRNERGSGGLLRRADGRSRFSPHRHSTGGDAFAADPSSQAQRRWHTSSTRQTDPAAMGDSITSPSEPLSESPPGPHPPPSTPAVLSNAPSGANSPSRRLSSASAVLPQLNEELNGNTDPGDEEGSAFPRVRQRRRSDSEAARHRGLGSGAARRNGVVEPDNPSSPAAGRSWLIYVVGTNLSENHPAFAAPSLFTDNPTYEDMILLSSLLGPVKPPVASEEDVEASGGLFRLVEYDGALVAESSSATERLPLSTNERCLICLCDYEAGEDVRQLSSCKHMYHRDCIDEWLTTGRNSCPLCRGEGVSNRAPDANGEQATTT